MRNTLFFLIFFSAITSLYAQEEQELPRYDTMEVMDYSRAGEYVIADVTVTGVKFIQEEVLVSLSGLQPGNTITLPGDDITKVLKKFWEQGLFADVKITATKFEGD